MSTTIKPASLPVTKMPTATSVASGALFGAPVAVLLVWALNTYGLREPMPVEVATALGGIISTATGTVWHIAAQILARFGISLNQSP